MIGVKRVAYSCAFMIVASASVLTGCGSGQASSSAPSTAGAVGAPHCPATPVPVVVSVDQWGDIVSQLGGACASVKTVLASSSVPA
jgi:zinc/manganese transport system substrate-binding protein